MLTYWQVQDKPKTFKKITGITLREFTKLAAAFEIEYERYLDQRDCQRQRSRSRHRGGGRKALLESIEDKLLFVLIYVHLYPTQETLGRLFDIKQSQVSYWIRVLLPVVNRAMGGQVKHPARRPYDMERVLAECPALAFIIDAAD